MNDLARHHSMVAGALARSLLPGVRLSHDPGLLHRLPRLGENGLLTVEPIAVSLESDHRAVVELELTLSLNSPNAEDALWELTSRASALWRMLNRAGDAGLLYSYSYAGNDFGGHTGEEWLEVVSLASRFWQSGVAAPERFAHRHATVSVQIAVVN